MKKKKEWRHTDNLSVPQPSKPSFTFLGNLLLKDRTANCHLSKWRLLPMLCSCEHVQAVGFY